MNLDGPNDIRLAEAVCPSVCACVLRKKLGQNTQGLFGESCHFAIFRNFVGSWSATTSLRRIELARKAQIVRPKVALKVIGFIH